MSAPAVARWLEKARSGLDSAYNCAFGPRPTLDDAAYHLQQAAEKLVKAALVAEGIHPPYSHNIAMLVRMLPAAHPCRASMDGLVRFAPYATVFRYPTDADPEPVPTPEQIDIWIDEVTAILEEFGSYLESSHRGDE